MSSTDKTEQLPQSPFKHPFVLSMGPQRAGTSWLDRYLRERDEVCLPTGVKEIFYFDRHFERGFDFYTKHFSPESSHQFLMEISTTAFDYPEAPARVYEMFGKEITLLCPLRHPVVRSYSLYLHYLRYGIVQGSLQDACQQNPQILSSSRYAEHIARWYEYFDKDQIKFVFQEDLEANQEQYIQNICSILNIEYQPPSKEAEERYNVTTYSYSGVMAGIAQRTADFLRAYRLYFIINAAKALGVKRIFFGKEDPDAGKSSIPDDDRQWLEERLKPQIGDLKALIGDGIPQWDKL